jgi:hypothetical protein
MSIWLGTIKKGKIMIMAMTAAATTGGGGGGMLLLLV